MEDNKIIELFLSRDESAIRETAAKYGTRLRQAAFAILADRGAAEECENDTYLQAWNRIPPDEPRGYLYEYLGRIIRHLAIDECRRAGAQKRRAVYCELTREMEECLPGPENAESRLEAQEIRRILSDFLAGRPAEQRAVFLRRYWYFDSIAEISRLFGIHEEKVKSILFRMRKALKKQLEKEGYTV